MKIVEGDVVEADGMARICGIVQRSEVQGLDDEGANLSQIAIRNGIGKVGGLSKTEKSWIPVKVVWRYSLPRVASPSFPTSYTLYATCTAIHVALAEKPITIS
jgi:hypothetical protein